MEISVPAEKFQAYSDELKRNAERSHYLKSLLGQVRSGRASQQEHAFKALQESFNLSRDAVENMMRADHDTDTED